MTVTVRLHGVLRAPDGTEGGAVDLADGATARDLLKALRFDPAQRRALRVSRDGELLKNAEPLQDGDEVHVFTALGGG